LVIKPGTSHVEMTRPWKPWKSPQQAIPTVPTAAWKSAVHAFLPSPTVHSGGFPHSHMCDDYISELKTKKNKGFKNELLGSQRI
jgi:hypothetical protein